MSVFYLAYGAQLHPKLLGARLAGVKPLSSRTVRIANAWLSFDFKGISSEPCYSNAIIKSVNDLGGINAAALANETDAVMENNEAYRAWLWDRCCPGLDYTGELPPYLEGVAFEFSVKDYASIMTPVGSTYKSSYEMVEVQCETFEQGDHEKIIGHITANLPIVIEERYRSHSMMPTLKYLRMVLIGSFFSTLSQPYIGHLVLLRHYDASTLSLFRKLIDRFHTLLLLFPFLIFHIPALIATRLLGIKLTGRRRAIVADLVYRTSQRIESLTSHL